MSSALGLCSRTGSAVAVVVHDTVLVGRWALDLTEGRVPAQVYHVAAALPFPEAEALIRCAVDTVTEVAARRLRELVAMVEAVEAVEAVGVIVGDRPVPESISARLGSHTLMHAAEGLLYRDALLDAAASVRLRGTGLPRAQAVARLVGDLAGVVGMLGVAAGPPWRKEHKLAAVAALTAGKR